MNEVADRKLDFGALLGGAGVFGGVRRFVEIGNQMLRRGHRFVLYHPAGTRPDWLPFAGEVRLLSALPEATHDVLLTGEPALVPDFEAAPATLKLYYCVHKNLPERRIALHPGWVLLANSSGLRRRLWRKYRVLAENAVGGIDLDLFHPGPPGWRPLGEPLRVLAYGRLSRPGKGTQLAVRAAERLAQRLGRRAPGLAGAVAHPVRLVLFDHVGPGNERDPRPALRCRIPSEFHLNLPQPELAALYRGCDLFVSAEKRAGWSNTVAEAMASGLPVVCTRAGTEDLARHLETAWVVRWRHPIFLAAGLHALVHQPERRDALRARALAGLREFTWERVAQRIEVLALRRLEGAARPLTASVPTPVRNP